MLRSAQIGNRNVRVENVSHAIEEPLSHLVGHLLLSRLALGGRPLAHFDRLRRVESGGLLVVLL